MRHDNSQAASFCTTNVIIAYYSTLFLEEKIYIFNCVWLRYLIEIIACLKFLVKTVRLIDAFQRSEVLVGTDNSSSGGFPGLV